MKLESVALAVIVLALSNACASGGSGGLADPDSGGGGTPSGSGGSAGTGAGGEEAGAFESGTGSADAGNPFATPDTGTPTTDGGGVIPASDAGTAKDGPDPACAEEPTQTACANCCATASPEGINTLNTAIVSCACGTSGGCATECATEVCDDVPATDGDECYTCLSSLLGTTGACYTPVQTACLADPGCAAYLSCEEAECSSLP
jgi:hypothetical protein